MILNPSLKMNIAKTLNGSRPDTKSQYLYKKRKRIPVFPQRLYDMLEHAEERGYGHIFSWMPDGKSFKVHASGSRSAASERAIVEVLKSNNFQQTKFRSFLRQLNQYGFERTHRGKGEFRHEFFVRGRRGLLEGKSIDDFQQPQDYTNDEEEEENKQNKSFHPLLRLSSQDHNSLFLERDQINYWKPTSAKLIPNQILQTTPWQRGPESFNIPVTLNNLGQKTMGNEKHRNAVFCESPCSSPTNQDHRFNLPTDSSASWNDDDTIPTIEDSSSDEESFDDWIPSDFTDTTMSSPEMGRFPCHVIWGDQNTWHGGREFHGNFMGTKPFCVFHTTGKLQYFVLLLLVLSNL